MDTQVRIDSHLIEDVYGYVENKVESYLKEGMEPNRVRMGANIFKEVTNPDNYFSRGNIDDPPIKVKNIAVPNFEHPLALVEDTSLEPDSIYVDRANGIERAKREIENGKKKMV